MCRWNAIVGSDGAIWAAPDPAKKFFVRVPYRLSSANPLAAYEHMCALYVRAITDRCPIRFSARSSVMQSGKAKAWLKSCRQPRSAGRGAGRRYRSVG